MGIASEPQPAPSSKISPVVSAGIQLRIARRARGLDGMGEMWKRRVLQITEARVDSAAIRRATESRERNVATRLSCAQRVSSFSHPRRRAAPSGGGPAVDEDLGAEGERRIVLSRLLRKGPPSACSEATEPLQRARGLTDVQPTLR